MQKQLVSVAISAVLFSASSLSPVNAQSIADLHNHCELSLNYDVSVEPEKLIVSEAGKEQYRIETKTLFVNGEQVSLNKQQQQLVELYTTEVSSQIPEVIALVNDAVVMASTAVSMSLTPMLGDATGAKVDNMMESLQDRIQSMAHQHGDTFYLGSTKSLDYVFDDEFEQEVEQLVQSSMGTMMLAFGSELLSADGDSFQAKIDAFSAKMETIGDDIELQMNEQAQELEARGEVVCENFRSLALLEKKLRVQVPQLEGYPLVSAETNTREE